ncbi:integral membrane protein [Rhodopirellula maiorica SM1]|uniref:Integral membrane protein n=1 Tax=Rhodopirellula maiorica SM1 TaxID=1265738 RepID=M5RG01_9BACT|nr:MMPL family transporter [Rhodopirellula maiorica]EMI18061.1 integral membrane protein [Rhodopirellula maiorica SM1]
MNKPTRTNRKAASMASRLIQFRVVLSLLGLLIFAAAMPFSQQLKLDRSIMAMFAPTDSTLIEYQTLQNAFGGNAVAMVVYPDTDLMSNAGLQRSDAIASEIRQIEGVDGILSPSTLNAAVEKVRPGSFFRSKSDVPGLARRDDIVARGIEHLFEGYTHSDDHQLAAVVVMLSPKHPPAAIESLQAIASKLPDQYESITAPGVVVGEPVLIHDGFELIERDGRKLTTVTLILLSIVVLVTLMDLRFVALTGLVVVWSIVVTEATLVLLGLDQSLVSTIMPAIITVIAVAAVLHLGTKFQDGRAKGLSRHDATWRSFSLLVVPILWTCLTDAAGFAALGSSRILPVRQFGAMIAIASIAVFVAIVFFAGATMMLPELSFGKSLHRMQRRMTRSVSRRCTRIATAFVSQRKIAILLALVLLGVSVIGTWQAKPETSFLNNFRSDSAIVLAYDQVEQQFGGAGVWDILLPAPASLTRDYLKQVLLIERDLRGIEVDGAKLTKVLSMADAEYVVGKTPILKYAPPSLRMTGMRATMPEFVDALLNSADTQPRRLRIMLRSEEQLPAELKTQLIAEVQRVVDEHTQSEAWKNAFTSPPESQAIVTGYYVMMSRLVSQLVGDQWRCLGFAGVLVWLLLWIATRSLRLAFAALLPNLLPAFVVLATVGWIGGKINMGAAMIAAVSIGLTIDGSVHLLAIYRRYRRHGHRITVAVTHAAGNVGVPVLLATCALVFGFSILSTSEFIPTATFGTLVAATLLLGTLVNLTLLPACVALIDRDDAN